MRTLNEEGCDQIKRFLRTLWRFPVWIGSVLVWPLLTDWWRQPMTIMQMLLFPFLALAAGIVALVLSCMWGLKIVLNVVIHAFLLVAAYIYLALHDIACLFGLIHPR